MGREEGGDDGGDEVEGVGISETIAGIDATAPPIANLAAENDAGAVDDSTAIFITLCCVPHINVVRKRRRRDIGGDKGGEEVRGIEYRDDEDRVGLLYIDIRLFNENIDGGRMVVGESTVLSLLIELLKPLYTLI